MQVETYKPLTLNYFDYEDMEANLATLIGKVEEEITYLDTDHELAEMKETRVIYSKYHDRLKFFHRQMMNIQKTARDMRMSNHERH